MYTLRKPEPSAKAEQPKTRTLKASRELLELIRSMTDSELRNALILVSEAIVEVSEAVVRAEADLQHVKSHALFCRTDCGAIDCDLRLARKRLDA